MANPEVELRMIWEEGEILNQGKVVQGGGEERGEEVWVEENVWPAFKSNKVRARKTDAWILREDVEEGGLRGNNKKRGYKEELERTEWKCEKLKLNKEGVQGILENHQ